LSWSAWKGRMSMGEAVDMDAYARIAGHFRRMCETLGIERRKRDVTPDPLTYTRQRAEAAAA
jgi:hypothetical protein